jgi:hypothetical protein
MLIRIIILSIIGYLLYRMIRHALTPTAHVKGRPKSEKKINYKDKAEDADFEEIE